VYDIDNLNQYEFGAVSTLGDMIIHHGSPKRDNSNLSYATLPSCNLNNMVGEILGPFLAVCLLNSYLLRVLNSVACRSCLPPFWKRKVVIPSKQKEFQ